MMTARKTMSEGIDLRGKGYCELAVWSTDLTK